APDFGLAVLAALGGMLCLYLFVRRQRRAREPMIDFALFRNRRFARGVAVALVATMALAADEQVQAEHAAERGQDGQPEVRGARAEFLD
ncbi:hypothetical protein ACV34C_32475, partial [Pseudomonas aeruginosa]